LLDFVIIIFHETVLDQLYRQKSSQNEFCIAVLCHFTLQSLG